MLDPNFPPCLSSKAYEPKITNKSGADGIADLAILLVPTFSPCETWKCWNLFIREALNIILEF
jgi:hypothetical protein